MSHKHHEKERYLQHIILNEIEPIDKIVIPSCPFKVDDEGQEP
jgi:hypothetical protein